jgi:hypothetical protein
MNKIINMFGEDHNRVNKYIRNAVIESYKSARDNPDNIDDIIKECSEVMDYAFTHNISQHIWNRLSSVVSLKYDIMLQRSLTEDNIDRYLKDVLQIINKENYINETGATYKLIETVAKIQYAYNLLGGEQTVYSHFQSLMQNLTLENNFNYYDWVGISREHYKLSVVYMYYILFHPRKDAYEYTNGLPYILTSWKADKILHYQLSEKEIAYEVRHDNYDLIYRDIND